MNMNELNINSLLQTIQNQTIKKRITRELHTLEDNCYILSIDINNNKFNYTISLQDNTNNLIYSFIFNHNYPFISPDVKINHKHYSYFLINKYLNLKKIYKIDCFCNTITCYSNWSPNYTINHIIKEIRIFMHYKRTLINKLFADKIKKKYLIDDIDLDSWL